MRPNWSQQDELAARMVETVDLWGRQISILLGAKGWKLPKPEQVKHPDRQQKPTKKPIEKDPNAIARWLGIRKGGE